MCCCPQLLPLILVHACRPLRACTHKCRSTPAVHLPCLSCPFPYHLHPLTPLLRTHTRTHTHTHTHTHAHTHTVLVPSQSIMAAREGPFEGLLAPGGAGGAQGAGEAGSQTHLDISGLEADYSARWDGAQGVRVRTVGWCTGWRRVCRCACTRGWCSLCLARGPLAGGQRRRQARVADLQGEGCARCALLVRPSCCTTPPICRGR